MLAINSSFEGWVIKASYEEHETCTGFAFGGVEQCIVRGERAKREDFRAGGGELSLSDPILAV